MGSELRCRKLPPLNPTQRGNNNQGETWEGPMESQGHRNKQHAGTGRKHRNTCNKTHIMSECWREAYRPRTPGETSDTNELTGHRWGWWKWLALGCWEHLTKAQMYLINCIKTRVAFYWQKVGDTHHSSTPPSALYLFSPVSRLLHFTLSAVEEDIHCDTAVRAQSVEPTNSKCQTPFFFPSVQNRTGVHHLFCSVAAVWIKDTQLCFKAAHFYAANQRFIHTFSTFHPSTFYRLIPSQGQRRSLRESQQSTGLDSLPVHLRATYVYLEPTLHVLGHQSTLQKDVMLSTIYPSWILVKHEKWKLPEYVCLNSMRLAVL